MKLARLAVALAAPLLLVSCILSPGKFVSSLDIRKDRSFTFTYVGEVIVNDPKPTSEGGDAAKPAPPPAAPTAETIARRRAVAETLAKEAGYRSVEYLGGDKFRVDYQMSGRLDRAFVYPINLDAMAFIPWVAAEVRKDGTVRIKAPAFGDMSAETGNSMPGDSSSEGREGTFTLTTDATLVMQNNEEGAAAGPGTKIVWKVTPTSKTVPTAVVRF
jgi:hypothetical protein